MYQLDYSNEHLCAFSLFFYSQQDIENFKAEFERRTQQKAVDTSKESTKVSESDINEVAEMTKNVSLR